MISLSLFFLVLVILLMEVDAFIALMSSMKATRHSVEDTNTINFHKILEKAGKTCLRPGGTKATLKLLEWSGLRETTKPEKTDDETSLLELSAGMGKTGLLFADKIPNCNVLITDIDENRLNKLQQNLELGNSFQHQQHNIQTKLMDMFDIDECLGKDAHFDCAITEASLTHFPLRKKRDFFQKLSPHTNQYLLHEICFHDDIDESLKKNIQNDMQKVLKISFFPESISTWRSLLEEAGFSIDMERNCEVGAIQILNPVTLFEDEGFLGCMKIIWNIINKPDLRLRMLATRQMISKHKNNLGYVIIRATKK